MYKKLLIIIGIIASLAIVSSLIGLRIFDNAGSADESLARSLTVLKNMERIFLHVTKLERSADEAPLNEDAKAAQAFREEYSRTIIDTDKLAYLQHSGDCKSCHTAVLSLEPELKSLQKNLAQINGEQLLETSDKKILERNIQQNLDRLTQASLKINRLINDELKQAQIESKQLALVDKTTSLSARLKRDNTLARRAKSITFYIGTLKDGINKKDANKVQLALNNLPGLVEFKPIKPPLNGICYSCHYAITNLPAQANKIQVAADKLISFKPGDPQAKQALKELRESIDQYKNSDAKVLELAGRSAIYFMHKTEDVRKQLKYFILTLEALAILIFILVTMLIARWVLKRLSVFSEAMKAISEGDYTYVLNAGSNDEVADLAHAFNLMVGRVRSAQEMLGYLNQELRELHLNTVKAFVAAIEAKDPYTKGHSENVAKYSLLLGQRIGLLAQELEELNVAALLHDIGKIGIPEDILNKSTMLTDEEYRQIMTHPTISAQIVGSIPNLSHVATIIRHHHERFDGRGYADGLVGESIPLGARILAIADAFDAMTSDRPYRESCGKERALEELSKCSGKQFDPMLVDVFIQVMTGTELANRSDLLSA